MNKAFTVSLITVFAFGVSCGQDEVASKVVPKEFWDGAAEESAALWAKTVYPERDGFTWKKREGVKSSEEGWVSYVGSRNILGVSNQVLWFGEKPKALSISFKSPWGMRNTATEDEALFLLVEKPVDQKVRFLGLVAQELGDLERVVDPESSSARSFSSIFYNPPTTFDSFAIYGSKGELKYREKTPYREGNGWRETCIKGLMEKAMDQEVFPKDDGIDPWGDQGERQKLVEKLREVLGDSTIPVSFLKDVLRGVELYSLKEVLPEVLKLSARLPAEAGYVTRMQELERQYGSISIPDEKTENEKAWKEYGTLKERYWNDEVQHLREQCDETILSLAASGNPKKIVDRIRAGKATDHHLYDFFRRDREGYLDLLVSRLEAAKTAYDRHSLLSALSEMGEGKLLDYLEKCNEREFVQCSAGAADLIREKRPEWRGRLQKALRGYQEVVKDVGSWPLNGLEALVPEDNPHYFDDEAVKEAIQWWRKNAKSFTGNYVFEAELLERVEVVEKRWFSK